MSSARTNPAGILGLQAGEEVKVNTRLWAVPVSYGCLAGQDSILVKALPPGEGCVQLERIQGNKRMPARMFFDTRLCPIQPSISVEME